MKFKYDVAYDIVAGVVGTAICPNCRCNFPAFKDDGEKLICPECDSEIQNPFYKNHKERKKEG
jgi:uncharacterized Zn finger protein (UPF0148 family)